MPQIRLLDQATVNKIAAGEVVEKPSSVVKEMVENSIDAGASQITVQIKGGGIELIRITDNGCGIPSDQVRMAFLRHSTSKIRHVEDLSSTVTLGFRGEALASIAAVARVEMLTKTEKEITGTRFVIEGGVEKVFEEVACPTGTTIKVENLFFNTPARRKFLKRPTVEAASITDLMQKMVLGHPEISIRYLTNKKEAVLYGAGSGDLRNSIYAVYGRDVVDKMLPVEGVVPLSDTEEMTVKGYISRPQFTKANRSYENFFINGRYVRSSLLEKAIDEAYKDYIVPGTFPVVVLHLGMDPSTLDVNVHPTKMEIRFMEEGPTREGVYDLLVKVLSGQNLIARVGNFYHEVQKKDEPEYRAQKQEKNDYFLPKTPPKADYTARRVPKGAVIASDSRSAFKGRKEHPGEPLLVEEEKTMDSPLFSPATRAERTVPAGQKVDKGEQIRVHEEAPVKAPDEPSLTQEGSAEKPKPKNLRLIGQAFRTYWLAEENDILYLVDQHAAHERVYYDHYRKMLREGSMDTQMLMTPIVCSADPRSVAELDSYAPIFEKLGYEVEAFGEDAVIVRGVPYLFNHPLEAEDISNMIDMIRDGQKDTARDLLLDKIAMMSCKAAVKGNDALSFEEAKSLLEQLFACENPYNCPHGRPTMISVTRYELEKRFKRV